METTWNENDERLSQVYILLLADVFERFRSNSLKYHGLCPSYYLSAPDLSWDAMLRMKQIELELVSDLSCIYSLRKVQDEEFIISLNNKYLKFGGWKQESSHII